MNLTEPMFDLFSIDSKTGSIVSLACCSVIPLLKACTAVISAPNDSAIITATSNTEGVCGPPATGTSIFLG